MAIIRSEVDLWSVHILVLLESRQDCAYRETIGPENELDPCSASHDAVIEGWELSGRERTVFGGRRRLRNLRVKEVVLARGGRHGKDFALWLNGHVD